MRWILRRIEIIRQYYVPGHTAYKKAFRRILLCISRGKTRSGEPNRKSPRLPEQFYRDDLSMRTQRPISYDFVASAALFVFLDIVQGVDPRLLSNLLCSICVFVAKGF